MESARRSAFSCHRAVACLLLLVLLAPQGCGHLLPSRSDPRLEKTGIAGIVAARFLPEVRLDLPGKGRLDGAVRGAGRGFLTGASVPLRIFAGGMSGCQGEACGYAAIGILAVAAASGSIGAVVGGVHGAIKAIPADEARKIENATRELGTLKIQETMRDRILADAEDSADCRFVYLHDAAPPSNDCVVDYRFLAERGIVSVLEVSVVSVGFKGEDWGSDPPLSVFLSVRVRRYRTGDGQMLAEEEFEFQGTHRKFVEWMADGGALTEEEFHRGYAYISGKVVREMLCGSDFP
jgi:hypothetical protein